MRNVLNKYVMNKCKFDLVKKYRIFLQLMVFKKFKIFAKTCTYFVAYVIFFSDKIAVVLLCLKVTPLEKNFRI